LHTTTPSTSAVRWPHNGGMYELVGVVGVVAALFGATNVDDLVVTCH
jgi:hypothetical protein